MPDSLVSVGEKAPDFELPRDGGGTLSLRDFAGKTLVLFFYPKDNTSGCTKEAIAFTGLERDFAKIGSVVVGASKDTVAKHDKFRDKHGLTIPLLSDSEGDLCERFGVWVEKKMYGKTYMGIERSTFLIDGQGVIRHIWRKVKVPGHAEEVLDMAKTL